MHSYGGLDRTISPNTKSSFRNETYSILRRNLILRWNSFDLDMELIRSGHGIRILNTTSNVKSSTTVHWHRDLSERILSCLVVVLTIFVALNSLVLMPFGEFIELSLCSFYFVR